ncbi:MAG TPA: class I SAM-dependent methyltransferase [Candidatus Eisenbacteria bacterium]|nr:class I SAM-dependent methyltransferase [Candidatus Eisenbacteria bacterium]
MNILSTPGWKDYELLDSGHGMRYERFGPYTTVRPDPQAIWQPKALQEWHKADVQFIRTQQDKGTWKFKRAIPEKWKMTWKDLSFWARLTSFKHTGVFPEQSLQWEFMQEKIKHANRPISVLNLFAYTGIASLAAAAAGAQVTHVDASKPSISWARDNQIISGLEKKPIRWILDDCLKFVEREVKRGNTYDAIIMDPPVYGHGAEGQIWKFNENFPKLLEKCAQILSATPLFIVVNAYAISSSSIMLENVLKDFLPKGNVEVGELCLEETLGKRLLSTGIYARWSA